MRRASWFLAVSFTALGLCAFVACVGDDASTSGGDPANDGGSNGEGSTRNDGSSGGDGSTLGDGATGGDGEAGVPACGYPGEACCAAPSLPCRAGTSCSTGTKKCLVNDVWAVGEYTVVVMQGGNTSFPNRAITAHYDGTAWTIGPKLPTDWNPAKILQTAPTQVRVVSRANNDRGGKMFYLFSPTEFRECAAFGACPTPLGGKLVDFYDITNVDNEYWLGGVNQLYRCAGGATSCVSTTNGTTGAWGFGNFAGTTANDLWYSALDRAFHYNGTAWTVHPNLQAYAIYQVRKDDTWVGTKTLQHWNGTAWSAEMTVDGAPLPANIYSIGGSATDDLWAVGNAGNDASFAAHWNGTAWTNVALPTTAKGIESLYAPSKSEAFIVGQERHPTDATKDKQGIFHWDGATWKLVPSPSPALDAAAGETQILSPLRWISVHGLARPRP